ncbi:MULTISPECIES: serine hydrolase domain-containing protein [unclassified Coleofasciculus]|uniref:serine hydrolase domain-containing protein n=1 Tax=unclassified Coleofasciculus TaxID=2692782 RepID=UPI00187F803C|nr:MULTISPECIES: serine hydrolase domain-containing protein [unclassified Coleofasciculus]MBE9127724.1 serine hydrolase [Coleofasciculus sp. LEGE 07081]MBE9149686.1 serine hydrolase [Coleofasciculus sp. LEGE 07092]
MKKRIWTPIKLVGWVILAVILLFSWSGLPALAQDIAVVPHQEPRLNEGVQVSPPNSSVQGLTDPQDLEAFIDQYLTDAMQQEHIPGAVVSVVKDGKIFFNKGYGYANIEKKIPVVPDQTLFRVASLSKLFTDTGVMQLYEQGKINLEAEVNQYLEDFKIENPYPTPVRVADLLTQTSGLSIHYLDIAAPTAAKMEPLKEYLTSERRLKTVLPPEKFYAYTDDAVALAGYLVQKLSHTPFPEYADQHILQPLEMHRSTFLQPPPPPLADDLAIGYEYKNGNYQPLPFLYLNMPPAASLSATATDMANFMIAHLQLGRYENSRILQDDTARTMHQTHFVNHPLLPGAAYGFHDWSQNNIRIIGHSGNLHGYTSILFLIPEKNLGFFFAYNRFGYSKSLGGDLFSKFIDHYYPVSEQSMPSEASADLAAQADRFTGIYQNIQYPRFTPAKLTALTNQYRVTANNDGTLTVARIPQFFFSSQSEKLAVAQLSSLLFRRVERHGYAAFAQNNQGQIAYLFNPFGPTIAGGYRQLSWYETLWFQIGWLVFCLLIFVSATIIWLIGYWRHRRQSGKWARWAKLLAVLVSVLNLVFVIGLGLVTWLEMWQFLYGLPIAAIALFYIPPITTGLSLGLLICTVLAWKDKYWSAWARVYYSVMTLAAIAFLPFLVQWNLLGF